MWTHTRSEASGSTDLYLFPVCKAHAAAPFLAFRGSVVKRSWIILTPDKMTSVCCHLITVMKS